MITGNAIHESNVEVYPNPVTSALYLKGEIKQSGGLLTVFDLNGKQVLNAKSGVQSIAVDRLPAGTYLLIYTKGEKKITRKFIKQ